MRGVTNIAPGMWGLSRIIQDGPNGFAVAAMLQSGLASAVQAFYPPLEAGVFKLPWALVRFPSGVLITPDGDTDIFEIPNIGDTLRSLTLTQRNGLRSRLEGRLAPFTYTDKAEGPMVVSAFDGAAHTQDTPLRRVVQDIYAQLGHSEARVYPVRTMPTHNTEYIDDFTTDPAPRWTAENASFVHDAVDGEMDINHTAEPILRYNTAPGSIEHEATVTASITSGRGPGAAVRMVSGVDDMYAVYNTANAAQRLDRWNAGVRTTLASNTLANTTWISTRLAAEGGDGANVVLTGEFNFPGATKPGTDPGWIAFTPDMSVTDTDANRLDDAAQNLYCGIGGRSESGTVFADYWRTRTIADRAGGTPPRLSTRGMIHLQM